MQGYPPGNMGNVPSASSRRKIQTVRSDNQILKIRHSLHSRGVWPIPLPKKIQFCRQSRGSLHELIDHFTTAIECGYLNQEIADEMSVKIRNAIMALNGYIRYLKSKKQQAN